MNLDNSTADPSVPASAAKAGLVWVGVAVGKLGIHGWSDIAAVAATFYSILLIYGWFWRVWVRWRAGKALLPETDRGDL